MRHNNAESNRSAPDATDKPLAPTNSAPHHRRGLTGPGILSDTMRHNNAESNRSAPNTTDKPQVSTDSTLHHRRNQAHLWRFLRMLSDPKLRAVPPAPAREKLTVFCARTKSPSGCASAGPDEQKVTLKNCANLCSFVQMNNSVKKSAFERFFMATAPCVLRFLPSLPRMYILHFSARQQSNSLVTDFPKD